MSSVNSGVTPSHAGVDHIAQQHISEPKKYIAEALGSFALILGGVGSAVLAGDRIGNVGIALAFGLTLLFLVYSIGPISGCHVNPAVTLGNLLLGRISALTAVAYVVAQLVGGFIAGVVVYAVAKGRPSYDRAADGLAANGWGARSPSAVGGFDGYGVAAVIIIEVLLTALLVFVVLSSTDQLSDRPLAGLSIGFAMVVVQLVSLPIDYTSVNPVRSLAVAPYQNGALPQVWVFVVFPLIGGALGALIYRGLFGRYKGVN